MNRDEHSRPSQNKGRDRWMGQPSWNSSFPEENVPADVGCLDDASNPEKVAHHELMFVSEPRVGGMFLGFHLIEVLGKGSFGTVYLARQGNLADRPVAIKISPRLDAEPRLLARLQHTNIVPIYSIHRAQSLQVVCMPYFGTTTLKTVCDSLKSQVTLPETGLGLISSLIDSKSERESRLTFHPEGPADQEALDLAKPGVAAEAQPEHPPSPTETLKYLGGLTYVQAVLWVGSRLASGLAHAHERRILHLDLKPANILLTDEGQPMLLDFNLSLDLRKRSILEGVGGTALYMSPEQLDAFRGESRSLDGRSDLYSLGIILFELLTGRRPFEIRQGSTSGLVDSLLERRQASPPPVRAWNRAVSPAVESMIQHCLEPDPTRRYQSGTELQEDIERHLSNCSIRHARERSPAEQVVKWLRRHPAVSSTTSIALIALFSLVLIGSASWFAVRNARTAQARLDYLAFRESYERAQLLLNTVHDGSTDHLIRGLQLAQKVMSSCLNTGTGGVDVSRAFRYLPSEEQTALRGELAELIMLEVRARVALLEQSEPKESRRQVYDWGIERLELARRLDTRMTAAFYQDRARLLSSVGQEDAAKRDQERAARTVLRSARDHYLLGTSLLALGQPERAEISLSRAVALDPRQFWTWFALGICHSDQGRHSDAAADFGLCTMLVPQFAWPQLNRGLALSRCGRLMEALASYDKALELDSEFVEAWVDRGLAYLELGRPDQALPDLERALALNVQSPAVMAAHAEALSRVGRQEEAEKSFSQLIGTTTNDSGLFVARGFSRLESDQTGAASDFGLALALDPRNARAYLGMAYLVRNKDLRAALGQLDKALAIDPEFSDAFQLRALIRARLNEPACELDVDRMLRVPTPQRLYNAACTLSLLSRTKADTRLQSRALDYLERAREAGLFAIDLTRDPDLEPLKKCPRFRKLVEQARDASDEGRASESLAR